MDGLIGLFPGAVEDRTLSQKKLGRPAGFPPDAQLEHQADGSGRQLGACGTRKTTPPGFRIAAVKDRDVASPRAVVERWSPGGIEDDDVTSSMGRMTGE
jgi:hypothetical protein